MNLTKCTITDITTLLIHFKGDYNTLLDILDELTIRQQLYSLDDTYIDEILDNYNRYKLLYTLTGDKTFEDWMFGWECEFYKSMHLLR